MTKKLIGIKFGRLTTINRTKKRTKSGNLYWECLCDCGNTHYATIDNLRAGKVSSCGCLKRELSSLRAKIMFTKPKRNCIVKGCENSVEKGAWGFCGKHYMRVKRYGNPCYVTTREIMSMNKRFAEMERKPAHEDSYRKFYGRHEHRVMGEEIAKRPLKTDEHVHHRDENKHNNLKDNLQIMTREEHLAHHAKVKAVSKRSD